MATGQDFDQLRSILQVQQEKWSVDKIRDLLGYPPWDEEDLLKCHFGSLTNTREVLESLEGYQVLSFCFGLKKSFDILSSYTKDLLKLIADFKFESESPEFWNIKNQALGSLKFATEKALFAFSASAAALIDHQRRIKNKGFYSEEEHSKSLQEYFGGLALSHFVVGLRNCMSHVNIVDCDWRATKDFCTGINDIELYLKVEKLLKYDWKNDCKAKAIPFIEGHRFGVKIYDVANEWIRKSKQYNDWLISVLKDKYSHSIEEYLRCERILFYEDVAAFLAASSAALTKSKSPSPVLSMDEVKDVLRLPNRREQRSMLQSLYEDKYGINPIDRIFD